MRGAERADRMEELAGGEGAKAVIAGLSLDFVFGKVWAREGLELDKRSLVTIGVLVALKQFAELENHLRIGLTNGLSYEELEEAVIQTAPYAGFPAAWTAAGVLAKLREESLNEKGVV